MSKPSTFIVNNLSNRTNRIDAHFFNPVFYKIMKILDKIKKSKAVHVENLDFFLDKKSSTNLTGGATPKGAIYVHDGVQFIRVQNIKENEIKFDNAKQIPTIIHETELKRSQLKESDVLLTITGSYGIAAPVPEKTEDTNINQHVVKIERNITKITQGYLSYYLNSSLCKKQMDRAVTGSSRPALDYTAIRSLRIVCPKDLTTQNQIVNKLDLLRKKALQKLIQIENLAFSINEYVLKELGIIISKPSIVPIFNVESNKIIDRLDAIYYNPQYYDLLSKLEKAKYKPKPLKKFVKVKEKKIIPLKKDPLKKFKLVELEDIDSKMGTILNYKEVHGIELGNSFTKFEIGEILLSRLRYYLRKVAIVNENLTNGLVSNECYALECNENVEPLFIQTLLRHDISVIQAESRITGSSRPRNKKADIESLMIPDAPPDIQRKIVKKRIADLEKIKMLQTEADNLMAESRKKMDDFTLKFQTN